MKKELRIYLFRHGRTFYNERHIFTGWKDAKLSPRGYQDAKLLAHKLAHAKIGLAFSSDLTRAKVTLREVLKKHPPINILIDRRLRERSYGELEGKSHRHFIIDQGKDSYQTLLHWHKIDHLHGKDRLNFVKTLGEAELRIIRRSYYVSPPKGESVEVVERRVKEFIKDLLEIMRREQVNVAISAHGNSIRPFRRYFEHLSISEVMQLEQPFDSYFEYRVKV